MALEVAGSSPVREPTLNEWSTLSESDRVVLFGFALFEVQSYLSHVMRQVFFLVQPMEHLFIFWCCRHGFCRRILGQ